MIIRPIIPAQTPAGAQAPARSIPGRGAAIADIWIKDRYQDWSLSLKQAMAEMDREQASYETKAKYLKDQINTLEKSILDLVKSDVTDAKNVRDALVRVDATTQRTQTAVMQETGRGLRAKEALEQRRAEEAGREARFKAGEEGKRYRAAQTARARQMGKTYDVSSILETKLGTADTAETVLNLLPTAKTPDERKAVLEIAFQMKVDESYDEKVNAGDKGESVAKEAREEADSFIREKLEEKPSAKASYDELVEEKDLLGKLPPIDTKAVNLPAIPLETKEAAAKIGPMAGGLGRGGFRLTDADLAEIAKRNPQIAEQLSAARNRLDNLYTQQKELKAPDLGSARERARANYAREILGRTPGQMEVREADRGMLDFIANLTPEDRADLLSRARLTPKAQREEPLFTMEEPPKDSMLMESEAAVDKKMKEELASPSLTTPETSSERMYQINIPLTEEEKMYQRNIPLTEETTGEAPVEAPIGSPEREFAVGERTEGFGQGQIGKILSPADIAYWKKVEQREATRSPAAQPTGQTTEQLIGQIKFAREILADPNSTQEERLLAQEYVDKLGPRKSRIDELAAIESARGMQPDVTQAYKATPPVAPEQQLPTPESLTERIGKPEKSEVKPGPKIKSPVQVELDTIARYYGQARNDLNNPKLFKKYFDSGIGEKALSLYELYAVGTEYQRPSNEQLSIIKDEISRGLAFGSKEFEDAMKAYAALKSASEKGWNLSNYKEAGIIKD